MAYERSIYSDMYTPNNMFGVTNTNAMNNLNNQFAFRPGSLKDTQIKNQQMYKDEGYPAPKLDQLKQEDWDQFQNKQIPLSLDRNLYKDVEGYTANAGNVMNDANILQPDFSKVTKAGMIPDSFIEKMKSLYSGGVNNTNAANAFTNTVAPNMTGVTGAYHPNMRDISGEVGEYGNTSGFDLRNMNMDNPYKEIGPMINFKDAPVTLGETLKGYRMDNPRVGLIDMWKNQGGDETTGFNLPGITGLKKMFQRSPQKQAAYDAIMGSQDDRGVGTYKGNQYSIQDGKIYSDLNPYGKNFDSMFGSKSVEEMDQNKIDWAMGRLAKFKDKKGLGISKRLFNVLVGKGIIDDKGGKITGGKTITGSGYRPGDNTINWDPNIKTTAPTYGPHTPNKTTSGYQGKQGSHHLNTGGYLRSRYNRGGRVGILAAF